MGPFDATTLDQEPAGTGGSGRGLLSLGFKVAAGIVVAASFGVWVYAYSGRADRPPPDLFTDPQLGLQAEEFCAVAVADVAELPGANQAATPEERALQVEESTERFALMVEELAGIEVVDPEDQVIMTGWLADWRTLLDDRRAYAEAVRLDPQAGYFQTRVADRERLDRRLTRVADTNRMPSCAAPTDVG